MARMNKVERAAQEKRNARNAGRRAKRADRNEARRKIDNMVEREAARQGFGKVGDGGTLNNKQYASVMKVLNKRAGFSDLMKTARRESTPRIGTFTDDASET